MAALRPARPEWPRWDGLRPRCEPQASVRGQVMARTKPIVLPYTPKVQKAEGPLQAAPCHSRDPRSQRECLSWGVLGTRGCGLPHCATV